MHDLTILYEDGTQAAVEVTAAADPESISLWKLLNEGEGRWTEPDLAGGWAVSFTPTARAKRILGELPALLQRLEAAGIDQLARGPRCRAERRP